LYRYSFRKIHCENRELRILLSWQHADVIIKLFLQSNIDCSSLTKFIGNNIGALTYSDVHSSYTLGHDILSPDILDTKYYLAQCFNYSINRCSANYDSMGMLEHLKKLFTNKGGGGGFFVPELIVIPTMAKNVTNSFFSKDLGDLFGHYENDEISNWYSNKFYSEQLLNVMKSAPGSPESWTLLQFILPHFISPTEIASAIDDFILSANYEDYWMKTRIYVALFSIIHVVMQWQTTKK
jgi:hypothetical protein